jgi:putative photosynthetic complex assembly protein 2
MADLALPGIVAAFAWWFSTGLILYLDGLPRSTFRWSMLGATLLMVAALFGLRASAGTATVQGAYCSFFCGLAIWGWQETAFLLGYVTGPQAGPDEQPATGWRHFRQAVRALLYHEIAILIGGAVVVAITWGEPNQVGTWTFLALWALRLSAKLNLFLGVRNLNEAWIPEHLAFVKRFLTRRRMNLLFPFSVTCATAVAVQLIRAALAKDAGDFETTALALLAMLLALAILEHWLMVLPINTDALWAWSFRSHRGPDGRRGEPVDPPARQAWQRASETAAQHHAKGLRRFRFAGGSATSRKAARARERHVNLRRSG